MRAVPFLFHRLAGLTVAAAAAMGTLVPAQADAVAPKPECSAPGELVRLDTPLPRVAHRVAGGLSVTIVAGGSSSTAGAGASSPAATYPSRLAVELKALFPRTAINVINRGVNGETATEMLARFDRDV